MGKMSHVADEDLIYGQNIISAIIKFRNFQKRETFQTFNYI